MNKRTIIVFFLVVALLCGCSEKNNNAQLNKICENSGFSLDLEFFGSDDTITYVAKNGVSDCDIKITCNSDSAVELIEIERYITSINEKMNYDDVIVDFVVQIINEYSSSNFDEQKFWEFLSNDMGEDYYYKEDIIFERFGENQYYSLMSVDSYAKEYEDGNLIFERYVITID